MNDATNILRDLVALHDDFLSAQSGHMGNHADAYNLIAKRFDVWERARKFSQEHDPAQEQPGKENA